MNLPYTPQYYLRRMITLLIAIDDMPQAARNEIANGCGPKGALIDLVDDDPLGADFREPCEYHDIGYHLGDDAEDKTIADLMFLFLMVLSVGYNKSPRLVKDLQFDIAMKYFIAVVQNGKKAFYANKGDIDN